MVLGQELLVPFLIVSGGTFTVAALQSVALDFF